MKHQEEQDQAALFQWAQFYKMPSAPDVEEGAHLSDYMFHPANGGKRNIREAARLKRQGVLKGVWDVLLPLARGGHHGLWIELKAGKNGLTSNQKDWGTRMSMAGYKPVISYGWQPAQIEIIKYLALDLTPKVDICAKVRTK